jgi:hypothetical protein
MTITKINSRAAQRSVQALVNVEAGPLAKLLGDSEGPAHEDWDTSAERPDDEWKTWKGRVKFVRGFVDRLVEVLTPPTTEPDFDLLSDFFSIERDDGNQRQSPGGGTKRPPPPSPPQPEPKRFRITERTGGFTVRRMADVPMPDKATLQVSVAYDLPSGDPLRNWSPVDFTIGDTHRALQPRGNGARVKRTERGNVVLLSDLEEDFEFSLKGFDKHRDLFVRVDDVMISQENDT